MTADRENGGAVDFASFQDSPALTKSGFAIPPPSDYDEPAFTAHVLNLPVS